MRPNNPFRIYLDSCTLITSVAKQAGYEVIQELLRLADLGRVEIYISALSYVEVRGGSLQKKFDPLLDKQIIALLDSPGFRQIEFYRALAIRARRYTQTYHLKNYDAIHLASAVEAGVEVLMTSDKGFPLNTNIEGVWVDRPYEPGDPTLFTPA